MSSLPSLYGADRTAIRSDRQDPDLRMFKSNVFVVDHDRSLQFYVHQLGFNVVADARFGPDLRWVAVAPPNGSAVLALVAPRPDSEDYALIGRATQISFITEDINATFQQWHKRGVRFDHPPQTVSWGGISTNFQDVDGNSFELLASDDMSREIEAQRHAIAEKLESERRTTRELEIAKQVQARLFPQTLPPLRTLDYGGICIQARQVGGDYYDFLSLGDERLAVVISDVSGKGIAAALLMANLQANLRSQGAIALDHPERLLRSVNQLFYGNSADSAYATLFFAEYDDKISRLRYANCGHLAGLVLRGDNTLDRLDSTCAPVGLFREWDCSISECQLFPGDTLALYTDGATESVNDSGEEFGEQRLIQTLRENREFPIKELLASIVDEVRRFDSHEQHDDITLIIAKCRAH